MSDKLISKIPEGPLENKWTKRKAEIHLVSPNNKRKLEIIVVGTGLGGASAAASLGELGYNVKIFCISDSPRRAHSIAAQGGINAAKNYQNDNDSVYRLFYDTIKGGDYRSREANVYRLAEVSAAIIDQCVAQGIPFAREYGGYLANRSFGGVQVSRTFYARGQTGQQLLLGAYASLNKEIAAGTVKSYPRHEMLDLVIVNGQAKGIIARNLVTGQLERFGAHAVVIATGGYGNAYFLSTNAMNSNGSAALQCYKKGAYFANPCFAQIHPTCIPVHGEQQCKLTLMSESLRNDGRIWVPKKLEDVEKLRKHEIKPSQIAEEDRDYYLERRYPAFGNLVPRDVASRAAKERCDAGFGVNETGKAVFLDFADAIQRLGHKRVAERYGNLFEMYEKITASSPWEEPMMIYPAIHYTMGGIWVDYDLQTTIPGLYAIGEANFSDHGGNRLGASALMQGLADGYFILPVTIGDYLSHKFAEPKTDTSAPEFDAAEKAVQARIDKLFAVKGTEPVDAIHKKLGHIMWEHVGMARTAEGLKEGIEQIKALRKEFWKTVRVTGTQYEFNQELEKALRLEDFFDIGELMAFDALNRNESCGGHFREESKTEEGEAKRDDENYMYVAAWEHKVTGIEEDASFLEMLDILNEQLVRNGDDPVAVDKGCQSYGPVSFDHDCREGICGACSLYIDGRAHGPDDQVTTCQLFMRHFKNGATITVEPWRSAAFPVIKDLVVDRSAFDKILQAGGFTSVRTGSAQDGNALLIPHDKAEKSMDAAACVGCGACVATCKNGSAMLFVAARVSSLALLPQGRPEAAKRARAMVAKMDELGFGNCTNTRACEMECPKGISVEHIARLNREFLAAKFSE